LLHSFRKRPSSIDQATPSFRQLAASLGAMNSLIA
jgi:hypothetical protein